MKSDAAAQPLTIDSTVLRSLRRRCGLTQDDLADKADVSRQTVRRLEQSNQVADTRTLGSLARSLGVSASVLLGEKVVSVGSYSTDSRIAEAISSLLEEVLARPNTLSILGELKRHLTAKSRSRKAPDQNMLTSEEEILGRWTSLIQAYESANWNPMAEHAKRLVDLGERLGRPSLSIVAHAYAAKAFRNLAGPEDIEMAEKELLDIPAGDSSALVLRLRGKMLYHVKQYKEAMDIYNKARRLLRRQRNRNDYLFVVENVKLLRNIARCHMEIAWKGKPDDAVATRLTKTARASLKKAKRYLRFADTAVRKVEPHCARTYRGEKMLLQIAYARLAQKQGDNAKAIETAYRAIAWSREANAPYGEAKMQMFLLHCLCKTRKYTMANSLLRDLQCKFADFPRDLRDSYEHWVRPHEKLLDKWRRDNEKKSPAPPTYRPAWGPNTFYEEAIMAQLNIIHNASSERM